MLEKFEGMAIGWDFGSRFDNNCIMILNTGRGTAEIARTIYSKDVEGTHIVKGYAVAEIAKLRELERKKNETEQELYALKDEIAVLEKALRLCLKDSLSIVLGLGMVEGEQEQLEQSEYKSYKERAIQELEKEEELQEGGENNEQ